MANLIIPIIEYIDVETHSVVALASDDTKAEAMVKALNAMHRDRKHYADPPLPVDTIAF
jgi:hypothetical protein